jgi:rhodanese-related sulfurtransferase
MEHIGPTDLQAWLADPARPAPCILDVREPWEQALCRIAGSVAMPMGQVPMRLKELDPRHDCVVVCHHGLRSLQVAMFLEYSGFARVFNLRGGIDLWAAEVQPDMRRY